MAKVFVVYDTKYGITKLVAEEIVQGIREVEGIETAISDVKEVDLKKVADSEIILMGSPNHIGRPSGSITWFIDKLATYRRFHSCHCCYNWAIIKL